MEENVFAKEEKIQAVQERNSNACNGHKASIAAGGKGHWEGDGCDCDSVVPSVSIDFLTPILGATAAMLILIINRIRVYKNEIYNR